MISCIECKNAGYCPLWKSEKIDMRLERESVIPINYFTEMIARMNVGENMAMRCEKFQKSYGG